MKICEIRCSSKQCIFSSIYAVYLCFMVVEISLGLAQIVKKINGLDCSDDSVCGPNGRCTVHEGGWSENGQWNSSTPQKSVCRCKHNWHGDTCSVCLGRFFLNSESGTITDGAGNYTSNINCTWLVKRKEKTSVPIQLRISKFATECGWDHLYVHDGSSFDSPLVAVLSGFVPDPLSYVWSELILTSGRGYIYFTSDSEFNMPGFQIDYKEFECSETCSENGFCDNKGACRCKKGWKGPSCSEPTCPNNCSHPMGTCVDHSCRCQSGFRGDDCGVSEQDGYWEELMKMDLPSQTSPRVTSHKSVVVNNQLFIIGGYSFTPHTHLRTFFINLDTHKLHSVEISTPNSPSSRYGHAVDYYNGNIYMCGGALENGSVSGELWMLDDSYEWQIVSSSDDSKMIAVAGHSVHIVNGVLFIFFGHSPTLGYLNVVQRFNLSERIWSVVETHGATVTGFYGHSSVYDESRSQVLIHGGFSSKSNLCSLKDATLSFNLQTRIWKYLSSSGHVKYLHSAIILDNHMFVYGGNTHNDTTVSHGSLCFSSKFLVYDIECDRWSTLDEPKLQYNSARYGHSANVYKGKVYIYGGFNGVVYNDLLRYTPDQCNGSAESECLRRLKGIKCSYVDHSKCIPLQTARIKMAQYNIKTLRQSMCRNISKRDHCEEERYESCFSCVASGCLWCGNVCQSKDVTCLGFEATANEEYCRDNSKSTSQYCSTIHNCHACMQNDRCYWLEKGPLSKCEDISLLLFTGNKTCGSSCSELMTCENCTSMSCMWCLNRKQCIDSNSYVTSFPYGLCHEWTIEPHKCRAKGCENLRNCRSCLQNPSCGFCNDDGDTGKGKCMQGRFDGPLVPFQCKSSMWNFSGCPLCQCNGYSTCYPNTDKCINCQNFTEGMNCERCQMGYWKDPSNDSACTRCECGDKADFCDPETGGCFCRLRGATGRKCEECDMYHKSLESTCFYELSLNYMLTFNLSKNDNRYHTEMNMFVLTSVEKDVEVNLNCSSQANLTIILRKGLTDTMIVEKSLFESYSRRFSVLDLKSTEDKNVTVFLYIQEFSFPFLIQVSFSQADQLDLLKFFITFFSCFFSLLLIAFVAWKFKQRYDVYRRDQRHLKEMAEMASRPCGKCFLVFNELEFLPMLNLSTYNKNSLKMAIRQKQIKAAPIAIEPLSNQKVAVLSVIIRLPHADESCTLPDQSGLAIASALVMFGNHGRRGSADPSLKQNKLKLLGEHNCNAPRLV